ncbi:MAG TPA: hypothetical protein VH395_07505 [Jatrophihabitantaceae bacterium]|jgi:hypothetical protein
MQLHPYVSQVQAQLAAAAALGDERTRATADALAAAAEPAMRLAVLAAVTAAADDITEALLDSPGAPSISVRIDGDELRVEVRTAETVPDTPAGEDADASARISLRLSEALKSGIEAAARADTVSVNTWLVRAASGALARGTRLPGGRPVREARGGSSHHITGWING